MKKSSIATVLVGFAMAAAMVWSMFSQVVDHTPEPHGPPVSLTGQVGHVVTVEGWPRGSAYRYYGTEIPGKSAQFVLLTSGKRVVVHAPSPLICEGLLTLTGTVVQVRARSRGTSTTSLQLDVFTSHCEAPP